MDLSQNNPVQDSYGPADEELPELTQITVYEFSSYNGYSIQMMSIGPGMLLEFMWFGGLVIAGIAVLADVAAGLDIFCINRIFYSYFYKIIC